MRNAVRHMLIIGNLVAVVAISTTIALVSWADRNRVIADATSDVSILRDAVAEQTRQTFGSISLALAGVAEVIAASQPDPVATHNALAVRQEVIGHTFAIYILDAQGKLVATSRTVAPEPADFSSDPAFVAHRDGTAQDLFIAPPRLGQVGYARGQWVIPLSRRLSAPDGSFAGIVAAVVSVDSLASFYATLRMGRDGVVGLLRDDATVLVRSPHDPAFLGRVIADTEWLRGILPSPTAGVLHFDFQPTDVDRIYAYGFVPGYPVAVYVGVSLAERLAAWRQRVIYDSATGFLAIVILGALSLLLARLVRRGQNEEGRRLSQLRKLTSISKTLFESASIAQALHRAADLARDLVPSHMAAVSLHPDGPATSGAEAFSLSEKYSAARQIGDLPDTTGILTIVDRTAEPLRLTQRDLLEHPDYKGLGPDATRHPPLRGLLAVPLLDEDARLLGTILLSDRVTGDFTAEDEALLAELARDIVASARHLRLTDDLREAIARSDHLRRTAEEARSAEHSARQEMEAILSAIRDAMVALDGAWRFTFLNPKAEELLDHPRDALLGRNVWHAFPQFAGTPLESECRRVQTDKADAALEYFDPQSKRWFDLRIFAQDSGGVTIYFHDITAAREREDQLRQSQKMEAVGQLTGGVAHDFNNLLTVILGNAELVLDDLDATDPHHRLVSLIENAANRASDLTQRLLAFSRRQPLDPRTVDINAHVRELEQLLVRTLGERYALRIRPRSGQCLAKVDPGQLQNALINLVLNARDAMPEGGVVTIGVGEVTVNTPADTDFALAPGRYVSITVTDTGVGMSPVVKARALEPFFTTKKAGEGTGLGLPMVFGFIKQSNGHILIDSEPGSGTAVTLYLPVTADPIEGSDTATARPVPRLGKARILVVEDDPLVRDHTITTLQSLGYDVEAFGDGPTALERLRTAADFDMLLCDVILGGTMNGWEVAECARGIALQMRVLFMSGYTEDVILQQGRLKPGVRLLRKPFRRGDLAAKLRETLEQ